MEGSLQTRLKAEMELSKVIVRDSLFERFEWVIEWSCTFFHSMAVRTFFQRRPRRHLGGRHTA